jgi:hypothetical protein
MLKKGRWKNSDMGKLQLHFFLINVNDWDAVSAGLIQEGHAAHACHLGSLPGSDLPQLEENVKQLPVPGPLGL